MKRRRLGGPDTAPVLLAAALLAACASPPRHAASVPQAARAPHELRSAIVSSAEAMIGRPYRYGGSTPAGFDCSGLVHYTYTRAGVVGLPRTASALEDHARPIGLDELRPADLLFFRLDGRKAQHVGIYAGEGEFIHAPSRGGRVERVSFEHDYWADRLDRAGRLLP
jgi:cell wall-associated NlpC family hydrolase